MSWFWKSQFNGLCCGQEHQLKEAGLHTLARYANDWWLYKGERWKWWFERVDF